VTGGWWQIVYTSADLGDGSPGGWGVKFASSPEARAYADSMLTGVDTRMDADELGSFPTAELLERRTRSLTARLDKQGMLLVHAVPAGMDATGRPGNVLVHAAVCLDQPEATAIEYWRSPDWLVPFGTQGIRAAQLPATLRPGPSVTRPNVARFLAQHGNLDLLAVLIEALFPDGVDPEPVVVLLVDSAEEAAFWIGAVTFVRDPRSDGDNAWATWCRPDALDSLRAIGVRLVGVRRSDAGDAAVWARERANVTVVDAAAAHQRTGDAWVRPDGTLVAEAGWATDLIAPFSAAVAEFGADVADDLLRDVAVMSADSSNDYRDPLWALAAAELLDPDLAIGDRDQQTEAVLRFGPQRTRPKLLNAIVDDWWRGNEQLVKDRFADWGDAPGPLLERRIVLLMAGALTWDDRVDGRWPVSERNVEAIRVETDNALQRAAALLELEPPQREEAAAILQVFAGYGLGADDPRVAEIRTRLFEGLDPAAQERLLPTRMPAPEPEVVAPPPLPEPVVAEPLPPPPPPVAEPEPPTAPKPVEPSPRPSWEDIRADLYEPAQPAPLAQPVAAHADLVEEWVAAMARAVKEPKAPFSGRLQVESVLDRLTHDDVADRLVLLPDRQLLTLLERAVAGADPRNPESPYAVGEEKHLSRSFLYRVAIATFRQLKAELDLGPPSPPREWTEKQWVSGLEKRKDRSQACGLVYQAWVTGTQ
jgi:hypothetical protein